MTFSFLLKEAKPVFCMSCSLVDSHWDIYWCPCSVCFQQISMVFTLTKTATVSWAPPSCTSVFNPWHTCCGSQFHPFWPCFYLPLCLNSSNPLLCKTWNNLVCFFERGVESMTLAVDTLEHPTVVGYVRSAVTPKLPLNAIVKVCLCSLLDSIRNI